MLWTNKKRAIKWGLILIVFFCISEVALRMYGFCDAVIMREDSAYEYIAVPQDRYRFGKHIFYNKYSQRNDEISNSDSIRICAFGDSFINGGTAIDQDSLATTKLTKYLSTKNKKHVIVLNISAGSWGPDNCYAYLLKHGNFNSKHFVLFVSSHDAFDDIDFKKVVGVNIKYPTKQYHLAWVELVHRYLIPKLVSSMNTLNTEPDINKKTDSSVFNTGFLNLYNYCKKNSIDFKIYLHADRAETEVHQYNDQGKLIIAFCKEKNIPLTSELDFNFPVSLYRDAIHFTDEGQEKVFEEMGDKML
jgi:desulfoferrodoxin (superoxide reductase-like protein)